MFASLCTSSRRRRRVGLLVLALGGALVVAVAMTRSAPTPDAQSPPRDSSEASGRSHLVTRARGKSEHEPSSREPPILGSGTEVAATGPPVAGGCSRVDPRERLIRFLLEKTTFFAGYTYSRTSTAWVVLENYDEEGTHTVKGDKLRADLQEYARSGADVDWIVAVMPIRISLTVPALRERLFALFGRDADVTRLLLCSLPSPKDDPEAAQTVRRWLPELLGSQDPDMRALALRGAGAYQERVDVPFLEVQIASQRDLEFFLGGCRTSYGTMDKAVVSWLLARLLQEAEKGLDATVLANGLYMLGQHDPKLAQESVLAFLKSRPPGAIGDERIDGLLNSTGVPDTAESRDWLLAESARGANSERLRATCVRALLFLHDARPSEQAVLSLATSGDPVLRAGAPSLTDNLGLIRRLSSEDASPDVRLTATRRLFELGHKEEAESALERLAQSDMPERTLNQVLSLLEQSYGSDRFAAFLQGYVATAQTEAGRRVAEARLRERRYFQQLDPSRK